MLVLRLPLSEYPDSLGHLFVILSYHKGLGTMNSSKYLVIPNDLVKQNLDMQTWEYHYLKIETLECIAHSGYGHA